MKTCATCNASHKNTVERVLRCMGCIAKPDGNTNWRPMGHNVAVINVVVRDLSTCEVLEMQIVENLQRADLHPLEEAEGYARMVREHGYTVESLADKIGKSKAYIYARMKLAELPEEGRKAFFDGELTASTALLIARIPTHKLQVQALQEVLLKGQSDREPMSARDVKHFLAHRYQMDLNKAPFARDDRTLVPAAGACIDCPKRTGVQPEIWDDVGSADVCTDTACFANKKAAQQQRTIAEAKARGITVITGDEAKKTGISHSRYAGEYVSLDAIHYADNKGRSFRELLGEGIEKVLIEDPYRDGRLVETIPRSVLTTKLIEAGLIDDEDEDSPSSTKKAKELQKKVAEENAFRQALHLRIETENLYVVFGAAMQVHEIAGPTLENAQQQCISLALDYGCDLTLYRLVPVGQTRTSVTFVSQ